jgi:glucokinase
LIGDLGGTKTKLNLYSSQKELLFEKKYYNVDFPTFNDLIADFLVLADEFVNNQDITSCCLAVAAPILDQFMIKITNLDWTIRKRELVELLGTDAIFFINDIESIGYYLPSAPAGGYLDIIKTNHQGETNNFVVVGIGTGYGTTIGIGGTRKDNNLLFQGEYNIIGTEMGHTGFVPLDNYDLDFNRDFILNHGSLTLEDVCSAKGINNLYDYHSKDEFGYEDKNHRFELSESRDRAKTIIQHSTGNINCEICSFVISKMVSALAKSIQHLFLLYKPHVGIFLYGDLLRNLLPQMTKSEFKRDILDHKLMKPLLHRLNLYYIIESNAIMIGAMNYLDKMLN